ncbi:MAG: VOC family protein [FCB group bacterium]|jgi:predicted 3-demethylubiquinone-9 3-methyltransferase (glyoxalase superfamily)|nr:VOC family protein [FCB group bacterium]
MPRITPCLWFNNQAEEAARFYNGIFKNSEILSISRYGDNGHGTPGSVMTVKFILDGQEFLGLNGGPQFPFTEAVSMMVNCDTQEEIDYYWEKLLDGGQEVECGWLRDKFGLPWQIVPARIADMIADTDPVRSDRVMKAVLQMKKLDLNVLERAYAGE